MCSGQMKYLFTIFGHKIYYADKHFTYRGLWTFHKGRNIRIVPLNRFGNIAGISDE